MDPKLPTKSALDLTIGDTANVCVWAFANREMKSPMRCDYTNNADPGFSSKRV